LRVCAGLQPIIGVIMPKESACGQADVVARFAILLCSLWQDDGYLAASRQFS
jgi:hypothetical protein